MSFSFEKTGTVAEVKEAAAATQAHLPDPVRETINMALESLNRSRRDPQVQVIAHGHLYNGESYAVTEVHIWVAPLEAGMPVPAKNYANFETKIPNPVSPSGIDSGVSG